MNPIASFRARYLDVLASVYIYNEHRGYTSLDRVLEAVHARCPDDTRLQREVAKHRQDEFNHYMMFKRWFELQGRMPLAVDRACGHIDRFIQWAFGCTIEDLDTENIVTDAAQFEKLCRVIMITEKRGLDQVDILLRNRIVRSDPVMMRIFKIVHRDEPDHFLPYQHWLERNDKQGARPREKLADWTIHKSLMFAKLPKIFLDSATPRLENWPHEDPHAYVH